MEETYVIVGDGVAGATAAETIRKLDGEADITLITDESEPLYNRIMLKSYMKGSLPLQYTRVHDTDWYGKRDIELELETRAVETDLEAGVVVTESGETYSYDKLVAASGGSPRRLPQDDGFDNLHYMWTMGDAEEIRQSAEESGKAVVVGGGLLGIDLAVAYAENGCEVDYLIREENWWSRGLDPEGAQIIHSRLEEMGVNVVTETEVAEVEGSGSEVEAAVSGDGRRFECDAMAVAIGQTPNSDWIDVEKNDASMVQVDGNLQASDPDVYAAGNMVDYRSPVFGRRIVNGSWDHSEAMGECAGRNAVGEETEFDFVNTYGVGHFDVQFLSIGMTFGQPEVEKHEGDDYRRMFYKDGRLVGAVLIGDLSGQEDIKERIRSGRTV